MAPSSGSNRIQRIVRRVPGDITGEELYQTEDGRWWKPSYDRNRVTGKDYCHRLNGHARTDI